MMRASIIIVVYNGMRYLKKCLASLTDEIADDEIIIVDNGSTDGSIDFIEKDWQQAKIIRNETNHGFAEGSNQGAEAAHGEYLVFLNQDTQVQPGWLKNLLAPFGSDPTVGLTTSKLLLMSQPDRIQICGQDVHFSGLVFGRGYLAPAAAYTDSAPVGAVAGASFAIRRTLWQQLGGFDERLYMYYEETDLSWRAIRSGHKCMYAAESKVLHDYHPRQHSQESLYYSFRNRYILLVKNWRSLLLFLFLPSLILIEFIDWCRAILLGRVGFSAKLKASIWIVTHVALLLRLRRQAQRVRKTGDNNLLEICLGRLNPVEVTGGQLGRLIVSISNVLFSLNLRLARQITCIVTGQTQSSRLTHES